MCPVLWGQFKNDEKWKKKPLGNSSETIGGWGCLLTSVTMMLNGMGYNETPETVNEQMKAKGGFQGAFFIPSVIPYTYPNVQYKSMQPCEAFPAPVAQIDAAVAAGKPVILQVDWNKQAGIQTHFVLVKSRKRAMITYSTIRTNMAAMAQIKKYC